MGKKRTSNQKLEQRSRRALENALEEWVVNDLEQDFGLDFVVNLAKPADGQREVTPLSCFIQLKASHTFEGNEHIKKQFKTDFLESYWGTSIPVLIVYYEDTTESLYWSCLQKHVLQDLTERTPDWWSQDSITISVPRHRRIPDIDEFGERLAKLSSEIERNHAKRTQLGGRQYDPAEHTTHHLVQYQLGLAKMAVDRENIEAKKSALQSLQRSIGSEFVQGKYDVEEAELDPSTHYFKLFEVCQKALNECEDEWDELRNFFQNARDNAYSTIYDRMVSNRYIDCSTGYEFTVVRLSKLGDGLPKPMWMAEIQYDDGEFYDENAVAIAQRLDYQLLDYNLMEEGVNVHNSCGEGNHDFQESVIERRSFSRETAICDDCGLSIPVLVELCQEEVPGFCEKCDTLTDDYQFVGDVLVCPDCLD